MSSPRDLSEVIMSCAITRRFRLFAAVLIACASGNASLAAPVQFNRDVLPILSEHCFECHGPAKRESGLRLDRREAALAEADSGESAIVPGKPAASRLIAVVAGTDPDFQMPPAEKKSKLTAAEVETLRQWIAAGAKYERHWAFVKPQRPALPAVKDASWPRQPLDRFVLARLEAAQLRPAPAADPRVLARRLSLDLIGLPPSPEEVDAFARDWGIDQEAAVERYVDGLLESPHYGERWARLWLDAARYGDTHGYEKDPPRTMWPWRDWVIHALNDNMPFDQFTIEQLAGDLLPEPTPSQIIATGFHRNTLLNDEGGTDAEEFRVAALFDRVETTSTVWLGLTLNCAQCHTHKFDPITNAEYYQFFAIFNSTQDGGRAADPVYPVPQGEDADKLAELRLAIKSLEKQPDSTDAQAKLNELRAAEKTILDRAPKTMVMRQLDRPRPNRILTRGDFRNPGDAVEPGVPAALHPVQLAGDAKQVDRLALANWLVDRENPLTARVIVNRHWAALFGRYLVDTPEDFGTRGELPSHPDLLDWLAVELMESGWDIKALHKRIVMSAAYRQSATATGEKIEHDPANRLYSRGPRFRVEAELVRDLALSIGGRLTPTVGGPSVFPPQPAGIWENSFGFQSFAGNRRYVADEGPDRYRRGLYTYWRRTAPYPMLQTFDLVSRDVCSIQRSRTNTPLQALNTLNDPLFVEAAAGLAVRMMDREGDAAAKAAHGLRLCVSRLPREAEVVRLTTLHDEARAKFESQREAADGLIKQGRIDPADRDTADLAAWIVVANVLLNLDETLNKN